MESIILVFTTVGSEEQGIQIAEALVEKGLAACVNIDKHVRSIYRWKGEIWDDDEFMLIIKTRESLFESVKDVVCSIHSYELPEILCVPVTRWNQEVHAWIMDTTVQQQEKKKEERSE